MRRGFLLVDSQSQPAPAPGAPTWPRRRFLRSAALMGLAAPFVVSCRTTSNQPKVIASSAKLRHASIGVGGMGWNDLQNFLSHPRVELIALCDVDANHLEKAAKLVPNARLYSDWRQLLRIEGERLDSVNVAVPDHMHFSIAYRAVERGKHVYCQKPLCHDIAEVRALARAAVRRRVVTQLGTQMAATIHERTAVQWLREGKIGQVTHAYLCSNRPGAIQEYRLKGPRPDSGQAPPQELSWDFWLGTAPVRPFVPGIYHPTKWRAWQDFGTGWSGDIGCHIFDPVWKGLKLRAPSSVWAEVQESWKNSPERRADTWPQGDHIIWTFPTGAHGAGRELVVEWFDGEYLPPEHIRRLAVSDLKDYPSECSMLIGTEGSLLIPLGYPPQLFPEDKFNHVVRPKLPPLNHYHQFVDACLGGPPTASPFVLTGPMTEAVLLGTVAIRMPEQKLVWERALLRFKEQPEANPLLARTYREGWHEGRF
jgi:predicted dehydrogenase